METFMNVLAIAYCFVILGRVVRAAYSAISSILNSAAGSSLSVGGVKNALSIQRSDTMILDAPSSVRRTKHKKINHVHHK